MDFYKKYGQLIGYSILLAFAVYVYKYFKDFEFIYHINEGIQQTFHSLVKADILIVSKSSYSYCTALLNENRVVANFLARW